MIQSQTAVIERINQLFGKRLINIDLLQQYKNISGNSLIEDLKAIMEIKKTEKKEEHVRIMCQNLLNLTQYQNLQIKNYLLSTKKTSIGKVTTLLLIPQHEFRQQLEKKRKKLIFSIRKSIPIPNQDQQLFQTLYYTLYSVKQHQEEEHQDIKHFKTLLISLKRMMNTSLKIRKATIFKSKKQSSYPLNLDVKSILKNVRDKLQSTQTGLKLENILNKTKHKKWLGTRLYKVLEKQCWSLQNVRNLIEGLKSIKLVEKSFRTKFHIIRKTVRKIILHLQNHMNKLIVKSNLEDENEQVSQIDENEKQFLQKLQVHEIQDIGDFLVRDKSIDKEEDLRNQKRNRSPKKNIH